MSRRRRAPDPELDPDAAPRRGRGKGKSAKRSWSTRLAWLTLAGGGVLLLTRVSVATVVAVHGDGMAPTLLDGDHVLLLRGTWSVDRGDVVVYDPRPPRDPASEPRPEEADAPRSDNARGHEYPDARQDPQGPMRNTAVVDPEDLDDGWQRVQARQDGIMKRERVPLRLGRVLAVPGDRVAFHVAGASLGVAVDGDMVSSKTGEPIRVVLVENADAAKTEGRGATPPGGDGSQLRATSWETLGDQRWQVLRAEDPRAPSWAALGIPPPSAGPVELEAPGYLVVADNRDEGACCDSRAIGWVTPGAIRGRVLVRLSSDPSRTPDLDPGARGLVYAP